MKEDRAAYSLRRWFGATLVGLGALVLVVAIMAIAIAFELLSVVRAVARDADSMTVASNLETQVLLYNRLSNLYMATGDPDVVDRQAAIEAALYLLLDQAHAGVGDQRESVLLEYVDTQLRAFLSERGALDVSGIEVDAAIRQMRPRLERLLAALHAFRMHNQTTMEKATAGALYVTWGATVIASGIALLLLGALLVVLLFFRRHVLRPIIDLAGSIEAFRRGDQHVRAPGQGAAEIRRVAETFNKMIDALLRQRQDQLAFTASVAHDLRNPLSCLKMTLRVLNLNPHVQSEERSSRSVAIADRQLNDMTRMLDDLLDSARIEAGHLDLHIEDVDLREVVLETLEAYRCTASGHQLGFHGQEAPVVVRADAARIRQVLGNLVSNAIKYSPGGGPVDVALETSPEEAVLSVTDQGLGIPPEQIADLFMPFRRRPDADRIASGAGLGLSVCSRIVTAHGGYIDVGSTPGEGSTFRVILPRPPRL